jgi:hypothetical protein
LGSRGDRRSGMVDGVERSPCARLPGRTGSGWRILMSDGEHLCSGA